MIPSKNADQNFAQHRPSLKRAKNESYRLTKNNTVEDLSKTDRTKSQPGTHRMTINEMNTIIQKRQSRPFLNQYVTDLVYNFKIPVKKKVAPTPTPPAPSNPTGKILITFNVNLPRSKIYE